MKKMIVILLCLLMIPAGCAGKGAADVPPVVTAAPVHESGTFFDLVKTDAFSAPSPEPAAEARDDSGLPIVYNVYDEVGFSVSEAEMFRYDIDGDGKEEVISFRLDEDQYTTTILIDGQSLLFDESSMLRQVILIDLDPATPWVNLLVEIDYASDDYFTTEVHMVNGKPVKGAVVGAVYVSGKTQRMYERTDFLGTRDGSCGFHGEQLTPDSDWYDCSVPTDEELNSERNELIEYGRLYHTVGEIPCTINGKSAKIAKNSYLYMTRFMPSGKLAEVRTEDGVTAIISYTENDEDWVYRIGGVPQDDLFDNLFYAD